MPFQRGDKPRGGGRPRGSKNRKGLAVHEIAAKFELDPFEILMMIACGDWKGLGYDEGTRTSFTSAGIEFEEHIVKIEHRLYAAKEACKYLYTTKSAVALGTGNQTIQLAVRDYTTESNE